MLPFTAEEKAAVEAGMKAYVTQKAQKERMTSNIKLQSFAAFDVDGDGVREYAAMYQDADNDSGVSGIFLAGSMHNSKFQLSYLEPSAELYPTPFDVLDIDGDGKEEVICEAGVYEGTGFMILSKVGSRFKRVFQETTFGV